MQQDQNPYSAPQHIDPLPRGDWPVWVRFSLWKVPTRGAALAFIWLCMISAVVSAIAAIVSNPIYFLGLLFLWSALMYLLAIRWVDRYGSWKP